MGINFIKEIQTETKALWVKNRSLHGLSKARKAGKFSPIILTHYGPKNEFFPMVNPLKKDKEHQVFSNRSKSSKKKKP